MSGRPWWNVSPHGTRAAYRRHLRHGERACEACLDAERGTQAGPRWDAYNDRRRERYAQGRAAGLTREQAHSARSDRAALEAAS